MFVARVLIRALVYAAACVGAGWFGYWVYSFGWSGPLVPVAVVCSVVGVLLAVLMTVIERRRLPLYPPNAYPTYPYPPYGAGAPPPVTPSQYPR